MPDPGEARGTLGTVRNAVLLLDLLSEGSTYQQLTDLAERSGLSVPTVHRLLRSLVLADLVEQDPRSARYGLGPELARLSSRYLARLPVLGALSPYLVQLRDAVQRTVHVAVLVRGSVVYVDRVDGADGGPYRDSHRVHGVLETAAGRLLLAHAPEHMWDALLAPADPADRELAEKERNRWRAEPFVYFGGDAHTAPEVAVPVMDGRGRASAALTADIETGAPEHVPREIAAQLRRAAWAAGRTLGHD